MEKSENKSVSVYLYVRPKSVRRDDCVRINIIVIIGREPKIIKLKYLIPLKDWDMKRQALKTSHARYAEAKQHLDVEVKRYVDAVNRCFEKYNTIDFDLLDREVNKVEVFYSFYDFANNFIDLKSSEWAQETVKQNRTEITKLQKFRPILSLSDFTPLFAEEYKHYMRSELGNKFNTWNKSIRKIKHILLEAVDMGFLKENPWPKVTTKYNPGVKDGCTLDELKALEQLLDSNHLTESVRETLEIFIFSCNACGLRFGDCETVLKKTVKTIIVDGETEYYFEKIQQKTKNPVLVPLIDISVKIFKRWCEKYPDSELIFPEIKCNSTVNDHLKICAAYARVKPDLSFHHARYTFINLALNEFDMDIFTIKDLVGHAKITTTQGYLTVKPKKIIKEMSKWRPNKAIIKEETPLN